MTPPGLSLVSAPEPQWWRPEPDAAGAVAGVTRTEPLASGAAGSRVPFWALMSFTFVLLIAPQNLFPALRPFRVGMLTAGLGLAALLVDRLGRGLPITRATREIKIAAALLVWAIVTVPFSYWPGGSIGLLTDLYLKTLAIFLLIANVVSTADRLRKVAWALTLMTMPIAMKGVENFLSGVYVRGGVGQAVKRIVGYEAPLTQNPNDLALVLNLILPLTVALFLITRSASARTCLFGVAALQVVGIVVTFSRAGFLTLATTLAVCVLTSSGRLDRRWSWGLLILAIVCVPLLPADYVSHLFTITDIDKDPTGSAQDRWAQQVAAIGYVASHPLIGAGIGQNILAMNEALGPVWLMVHNAYLEYAIDLGLPGLALFVLLLVGSVRNAGRAARLAATRPGGRELSVLANGIRSSLLAFAVAAFFSPVAYHFHFYYFAGLAIAARAIAEGDAGAAPLELQADGEQP
ncbi:MAG: O-antigen ligase family protein [Candidatus Rokuibacteriota bacterium]